LLDNAVFFALIIEEFLVGTFQCQQESVQHLSTIFTCTLNKLTSLSLSFNNFTGSLPSWIENWKELTTLWLQENSFQGALLTEVGALTDLEQLSLHANSFSGTLSTEICLLTALLVSRFKRE
jgi:Leucine-rich repeat (LRR) protein